MQSKVSVVLLKAKNIDEQSDMNKMAVHLEQVLLEREGVDFKARQGLTDSAIKSADFIVFCGYDSALLGEFFKSCGIVETLISEDKPAPTLFLYEQPGESIMEFVNYILRRGGDIGRVDVNVFENIIDTWTYNDIIGTVDIKVKKLLNGVGSTAAPSAPASK